MEISIVIPVYNSATYLPACLNSVFAQTFQDFEVICVNDGSTDESLDILKKYAAQYPDKMNIITIPNGGQANARNVGIDNAKGAYIAFVDSDDTMDEQMLAKMHKATIDNDIDFISCNIERIYEGGISKLEKKFDYDKAIAFEGKTTVDLHPELICYIKPAPYAKLISKAFLDEHKIRFIKGYIYEDLVFTQTILAHHPNMYVMKDRLYKYLVRANSTMTSKKSRVDDMFVSFKNLYSVYQSNNIAETFKAELEYLCLYHVMVGTSFRMWRSKQYSLKQSISSCRKYVKAFGFGKNNRYIAKEGIIVRMYLNAVL